MTEQPVRRAKHLIDPSQPRVASSAEDRARLERVQRWVLSVLAATTIFHLSWGLLIFAAYLDDSERVSQVGLSVLGAVFGVLALAAAFAIHRRSPLNAWVLLGALPAFVVLGLLLA